MVKNMFLLFLGVILTTVCALAQTTLNPDISVVGDIHAFSHNDLNRPTESREFNLSSPDMELMISGYLNPYSRADAVISWEEGENAKIEEFYATVLRGLPLNMNLRVGKYRLEFGRLNSTHPHAYSFIYQPLPHQEFFGGEGLNDMAIRASSMVPTGKLYTEFMGAILKGDIFNAETEDSQAQDSAETRIRPGFFGRMTTSAAVSEYGELSAGMSFVTADYDKVERLRASVYGFDLKYKWKPNRYTSLTIEGEGLGNRLEKADGGKVSSYGGYAYFDYRFRQKYNIGSIFEYSQGKLDKNEYTWRAGGFVGFAPIEETSLIRLVGDWTKPRNSGSYWTATIQLVFSLGPHQPHSF